MTLFADIAVEKVFAAYPSQQRKPLLRIRDLIFKTALETDGVGELLETLRWGQPSYSTGTE